MSKKMSLILAIILVFGAIFVYTYLQQEKHFKLLREEKIELEKQLKLSQKELDLLKAELEQIESSEAKEKMIREKLGMMKKDEIQYVIKKIEEVKE